MAKDLKYKKFKNLAFAPRKPFPSLLTEVNVTFTNLLLLQYYLHLEFTTCYVAILNHDVLSWLSDD